MHWFGKTGWFIQRLILKTYQFIMLLMAWVTRLKQQIYVFQLTGMHGFRDNEVLLPTGNDVIVISPLGAFHTGFVDGIWKSDTSFIIMVHWHSSRISYRFGIIRNLFWLAHDPDHFRGVFRVKHPKFHNYTFLIPKSVFLTPERVFWAIVRENWFTGIGCSSVE